MALNTRKTKTQILQSGLHNLESQTNITATSPGSIARALLEIFATEMGDFYDLLDYNISQTLVSKASGQSLENIGALFNVSRNKLSEINIVDAATGTFYFYLDTPYHLPITIPTGTMIYSNNQNYVGAQIRYELPRDVTIPAGRRKVFAPIRPSNIQTGLTVGPNVLTVHSAVSPTGTSIKCTNPKAIAAKTAYETDDNYRTRIINEIRVNGGGTITALRFAALKVEGVRDVRIAPALYGMGTMEILVVTETGIATENVRGAVSAALESIRPAGVRLYLKTPTRTEFNVSVGLMIRRGTTAEERDVVSRANMAITLYLNSLLPGDKLVYTQMVQRILDASDLIQDVRMINYAASGEEISRANYEPSYDEQVVPGEIKIQILS